MEVERELDGWNRREGLTGQGKGVKVEIWKESRGEDGSQRQAGGGTGMVGPRWMWSETDEGSECGYGARSKSDKELRRL